MLSQKKQRIRFKFFKAPSFWISIVLSLVVLSVYVFSQPAIGFLPTIGILNMIETKTLDIRFWLRGEIQPQDDIVIIEANEKTDDELGRWQSAGRLWLAKLVNILHEGGAKVVGFDLTLAEPTESSALDAVDKLKTHYLAKSQDDLEKQADMLAYFDEIKATHDYDQLLAEAIQRAGNVVLGIYHFFSEASARHLTPGKNEAYQQLIKRSKYSIIKFPPNITRQPLRLLHSFGVEPNLPILSTAAKSFGHFAVVKSADGYVRFAPLLVEYMGDYYPSLDLELVRLALQFPLPPIIHALGKEGGDSVDVIQLGNIFIPTDESGRLFINYYGAGRTFPYYTLSDVILERVPPETFKDKIVLFGFTSLVYQDLHSTTFEQDTFPGVEVHATIIENILRQDFLTSPEWTIPVNAAIICLFGIVLGGILQRAHPFSGALTALICLIISASIAHTAFLVQKIWLNVTFPFIFIILDYLVITSYKYFTEERKKRVIKNAFQHYVAPVVVEQMLERVDKLHLGGERKQLTAFFSDIRGFTSISEKMQPEDLVKFLNEYLTEMTRIVLKYEGTVDKYMGDAIMAFYGAPLDQPDHAVRACKTAIEMISRLKELRAGWSQKDLPFLDIGIGINSGDMSVGNMGSEERFDYTIMGDNVNLASRLEGINKQYGTNIVISEFTYALVRGDSFIVRELDSVKVKGKQKPVTIYELIGYGTPDQQTTSFLEIFTTGVKMYKDRRWDHAITQFKQALQMNPKDIAADMYIERCETYKHTPPPEDWDGAYVMKTK